MEILDFLETESIFVLREVRAQFSNPVILFSGGKDSLTLLLLTKKSFPGKFPFPVLHIDTGHNFPETLEFRDRIIRELGATLIVRKVEDTIKAGRAVDETGRYPSRNRQQSRTLLDAITEFGFDAAIGGARRDEEKARAKERFFSVRNALGEWNPRRQNPEIGQILNGDMLSSEQMRVFPLNNWTEKDVWMLLQKEKASVPSLYFTHKRKCVRRPDGTWLPLSSFVSPAPEDKIIESLVRFRTVGDMTCTSPVFSQAGNIMEILSENEKSGLSERGSRADDKISDSAMEDRKKEGYF